MIALALTLPLSVSLAAASAAPAEAPRRIVTVGTSITEIVYALGHGQRIIAVDTSSVRPPEASTRPQVGYQRNLAAEGILALKPDLVLASEQAGPPVTLAQLRSAGVRVEVVPGEFGPGAAVQKIRAVARILGERERGELLVEALVSSLRVPRVKARGLRVLFVYARGNGALQVSGTDTAAAAMIDLVGAKNAVTDYAGYRPLTAEALVAAAPDVILMPERGLAVVGGAAVLKETPGVALTPAGRAGRILGIDDAFLLSFGPATAEAVASLEDQLLKATGRE